MAFMTTQIGGAMARLPRVTEWRTAGQCRDPLAPSPMAQALSRSGFT